MTMNLRTATEPEVDQQLADASEALAKAQARIAGMVNSVHRMVGDEGKVEYHGRHSHRTFRLTDAEALAAARKDGAEKSWDQSALDYCLGQIDANESAAAAAGAVISAGNKEFARRGGWSRFFIVNGPGGHIHSSQHCSTCNNGRSMTAFGWLPALSGLTEKDAVEAEGAILCTVCFPSAPVEWTNKYEAAAAAKAALKCTGSGEPYDRSRPAELRRMSKWGYCIVCRTRQTVTPNGAIRAHKAQ